MPTRAELDLTVEKRWWWPLDPSRSIKSRIILLTVGGVLVTTLLLALVTGRLVRQYIQTKTSETFESIALQLGNQFERDLAEQFHELQTVAERESLWAPLTSRARQRQVLDALQSAQGFAWVGFADQAGSVLVSAGGVLEDARVDQKGWFVNGRVKSFVSDARELSGVFAEEFGTGRFIEFAEPVLDLDGRVSGVLAAHRYWTFGARDSMLPPNALRDEISFTLYSKDGRWLLGSRGEQTERLSAPPMRGLNHGLYRDFSDGKEYLSAFSRTKGYKAFPGHGWIAVVSQPVDQTFAFVHQLQIRIIQWGFLLSGASAVPGWLVAKRIARRAHVITASADRIRAGDILAVMPSFASRDEIATMSIALGNMVYALRKEDNML